MSSKSHIKCPMDEILENPIKCKNLFNEITSCIYNTGYNTLLITYTICITNDSGCHIYFEGNMDEFQSNCSIFKSNTNATNILIKLYRNDENVENELNEIGFSTICTTSWDDTDNSLSQYVIENYGKSQYKNQDMNFLLFKFTRINVEYQGKKLYYLIRLLSCLIYKSILRNTKIKYATLDDDSEPNLDKSSAIKSVQYTLGMIPIEEDNNTMVGELSAMFQIALEKVRLQISSKQ